MEFLHLPLAALSATGFGMTAGWGIIASNILIRSALAISGRQHNLKFIEFVPLGLGPQPFRDLQKCLQALTRGKGLWLIHGGIISSFGRDRLILLLILLFSALFCLAGRPPWPVLDGGAGASAEDKRRAFPRLPMSALHTPSRDAPEGRIQQ
ncbi:MAG: hypothetical protein Q8L40_00710 [Burkholderiales bacterium]|nr:hypothetical protein [Burkholderiales bacterium]